MISAQLLITHSWVWFFLTFFLIHRDGISSWQNYHNLIRHQVFRLQLHMQCKLLQDQYRAKQLKKKERNQTKLQIWIFFLHTCSDSFVLAWPHCQLMCTCVHITLHKSVQIFLVCFTLNILISPNDYLCMTKRQAQPNIFFLPLIPTKLLDLFFPSLRGHKRCYSMFASQRGITSAHISLGFNLQQEKAA